MTFLCISRQLLNQSTLATPSLRGDGGEGLSANSSESQPWPGAALCYMQRGCGRRDGGMEDRGMQGRRTGDGGRRRVSRTLERVGDDAETEGQSIAASHIELHFHLRHGPHSHGVDSP